jgi:hypothetical protein
MTDKDRSRAARGCFANFAQVATKAQAEHGVILHSELSSKLAKGYPELSIIEAKIAECFEARLYDLNRGVI